jgi:hypothetical protein
VTGGRDDAQDDAVVGRAFEAFRTEIAANVQVPPYAVVEHRARVRRRTRTGGAVLAFAAIVAAVAVVVPNLANRSGNTQAVARPPQVTVTVTVPPAPLTSLGPISLDDVSFSSDTDGIALGSQCNSQVCETVTRRSTDGGQTYDAAVPVASGEVARKIADFRGGYVYAYAPELFVSADHGMTWSPVDVGGLKVQDIAEDGHGGLEILATAPSGPATVLREPLGTTGAPTSRETVPGTDPSARLQQPEGGAEVVVTSGVNAQILERKSGSNWVSVKLPDSCEFPSLSTSEDTWWVACGSGHAKTESTRVFRSTGGGKWTALASPPDSVGQLTITAYSPSTAYLSGLGFGLAEYTDASGRWTNLVPAASAIGEPHILNGGAWVTSGRDVYRRTDEGWVATSLD